jgi:hypothetical protein
LGEYFAQSECDRDLEKFLEQAKTFIEPSLEEPLGECFAQFGYDPDFNKFIEQAGNFNEPS